MIDARLVYLAGPFMNRTTPVFVGEMLVRNSCKEKHHVAQTD